MLADSRITSTAESTVNTKELRSLATAETSWQSISVILDNGFLKGDPPSETAQLHSITNLFVQHKFYGSVFIIPTEELAVHKSFWAQPVTFIWLRQRGGQVLCHPPSFMLEFRFISSSWGPSRAHRTGSLAQGQGQTDGTGTDQSIGSSIAVILV